MNWIFKIIFPIFHCGILIHVKNIYHSNYKLTQSLVSIFSLRLIIIYRFQVSNIIIQCLCTLLCAHHRKTIFHSSSIYLTPFNHYTLPLLLFSLVTTNLLFVSMSLLLFCSVRLLHLWFLFHIWVKSYSFCIWFISLKLILSRSLRVDANGNISHFLRLSSSSPLCVCVGGGWCAYATSLSIYLSMDT